MKNCEVAEFGFIGPGHRDRAPGVAQAVARLVLDRREGSFLLLLERPVDVLHPAGLDHEPGDHPMEDQAVVEPLVNVLEEVVDRDRALVRSSSMVIGPAVVSSTTTGWSASALGGAAEAEVGHQERRVPARAATSKAVVESISRPRRMAMEHLVKRVRKGMRRWPERARI